MKKHIGRQREEKGESTKQGATQTQTQTRTRTRTRLAVLPFSPFGFPTDGLSKMTSRAPWEQGATGRNANFACFPLSS